MAAIVFARRDGQFQAVLLMVTRPQRDGLAVARLMTLFVTGVTRHLVSRPKYAYGDSRLVANTILAGNLCIGELQIAAYSGDIRGGKAQGYPHSIDMKLTVSHAILGSSSPTGGGGYVTSQEEFITVQAAADRLAVSRWMIYRLIWDQQVKSIQIGRCRRIIRQSLDDYIADLIDGVA
jgi:excisionase family DNA binding protein